MSRAAPTDRLARPMRDLRLSVTDRCNFRCPYCMPAEIYGDRYRFLPKPELLSFEELERLVRIFVSLGVEKVRITGGEPLLRHELPRLVERLAALDGVRDLTLTTNGFLLASQARRGSGGSPSSSVGGSSGVGGTSAVGGSGGIAVIGSGGGPSGAGGATRPTPHRASPSAPRRFVSHSLERTQDRQEPSKSRA